MLGCILLFLVSPSGKSIETAFCFANCIQPEALAIVLEDLNQCNQSSILPGFPQVVKSHNTGHVLYQSLISYFI